MSDITERAMRGDYISKQECLEHAEELDRLQSCYGAAMDAMEEHERKMQKCICEYDGDARDDGTPYTYRIPVAGCPVHAEEDSE